MKFTIITPKPDFAGPNISEELGKLGIEFVETDERSIYLEEIDKKLEGDFIIFATTHRGKNPRMLSVHAPGNWGKAELGGKPGKVCMTSANVLKIFFKELNENLPEGWSSTMEVTHHGPLIQKPCLFIEIGSNEEDWKNKEAGKAIANTIKNAIEKSKENKEFIPAIAIGGPHYCPNFNKVQLNSKYAISHIIPEYALPLTKEMLKEAVSKTQEKVKIVIIDWKGIGKSEQRQKMLQLIGEEGLEVVRTSEIDK